MNNLGQHRLDRFEGNLRAVISALGPAVVLALVLASVPVADAQSFQVLHSFTGGGDGATPTAGVVLDAAGNLYGTASGGGSNSGSGTVYELKRHGTGWTLNPLYSFTGEADGAHPLSRVVFIAGQPGVLYGTTSAGGLGYGVVFRLRPSPNVCHSTICPWTEAVLYSFSGAADGNEPTYGDVAFDQTHNMYGTTFYGGSDGGGVVWELTPPGSWGTESVLHAFVGGSDGADQGHCL